MAGDQSLGTDLSERRSSMRSARTAATGMLSARAKPLVPDCAVLALDVGVLLRLAGLDMLNCNAQCFLTFQQLATAVELRRQSVIGTLPTFVQRHDDNSLSPPLRQWAGTCQSYGHGHVARSRRLSGSHKFTRYADTTKFFSYPARPYESASFQSVVPLGEN